MLRKLSHTETRSSRDGPQWVHLPNTFRARPESILLPTDSGYTLWSLRERTEPTIPKVYFEALLLLPAVPKLPAVGILHAKQLLTKLQSLL